ncbi:MAG: hypothetical protein PVI75_08045 [Gammaproteobacteria bacterium]|jgi:hypothetical protein
MFKSKGKKIKIIDWLKVLFSEYSYIYQNYNDYQTKIDLARIPDVSKRPDDLWLSEEKIIKKESLQSKYYINKVPIVGNNLAKPLPSKFIKTPTNQKDVYSIFYNQLEKPYKARFYSLTTNQAIMAAIQYPFIKLCNAQAHDSLWWIDTQKDGTVKFLIQFNLKVVEYGLHGDPTGLIKINKKPIRVMWEHTFTNKILKFKLIDLSIGELCDVKNEYDFNKQILDLDKANKMTHELLSSFMPKMSAKMREEICGSITHRLQNRAMWTKTRLITNIEYEALYLLNEAKVLNKKELKFLTSNLSIFCKSNFISLHQKIKILKLTTEDFAALINKNPDEFDELAPFNISFYKLVNNFLDILSYEKNKLITCEMVFELSVDLQEFLTKRHRRIITQKNKTSSYILSMLSKETAYTIRKEFVQNLLCDSFNKNMLEQYVGLTKLMPYLNFLGERQVKHILLFYEFMQKKKSFVLSKEERIALLSELQTKAYFYKNKITKLLFRLCPEKRKQIQKKEDGFFTLSKKLCTGETVYKYDRYKKRRRRIDGYCHYGNWVLGKKDE